MDFMTGGGLEKEKSYWVTKVGTSATRWRIKVPETVIGRERNPVTVSV
jgi:hypothetical protein